MCAAGTPSIAYVIPSQVEGPHPAVAGRNTSRKQERFFDCAQDDTAVPSFATETDHAKEQQ
jgi:hypothetical protein